MKTYLYAAAIIAFLSWSAWCVHYGKESEKQKAVKVALEYREQENKLLAQLEEAKKKREIITRERIIQVEKIIDQCLDRPLPADIKRLRDDAARH